MAYSVRVILNILQQSSLLNHVETQMKSKQQKIKKDSRLSVLETNPELCSAGGTCVLLALGVVNVP